MTKFLILLKSLILGIMYIHLSIQQNFKCLLSAEHCNRHREYNVEQGKPCSHCHRVYILVEGRLLMNTEIKYICKKISDNKSKFYAMN